MLTLYRILLKKTKTFSFNRILPFPSSNLIFLNMAYLATFAGYNVWRSTFHNYAIDKFQVDPQQLGIIFSLASIPGVLAFCNGFIAHKMRLYFFLPLSCISVGIGLIWIGVTPTWHYLLPAVILITFGFTSFYTIVNSIRLLESNPEEVTLSLGCLKSLGPFSSIGAALLVLYFLKPLGFNLFFILAGIGVIIFGVLAVISIWNKEYSVIHSDLRLTINLWPYYVLNFMAGGRSAIFKTFVLYFLIHEYHFKITGTALIVLVSNFLGAFGYLLIGYLGKRFDKRNLLTIMYIGVASIFFCFCFVKSVFLLSILFLLDSVLFSTSVITEGHLKKKSPPRDLIGDIATGLTLFSIAEVLTPLLGSMLWELLSFKATFLLGSILACISILVSRKLND